MLNLFLIFFLREKKRNIVIVGDTVTLTEEGLVSELMEKFEKGEVSDKWKKAEFCEVP